MQFSNSLLIKWFYNLKENKLNNEILCIFLDIRQIDNHQFFISKKIKILNDTLKKNNINSNSYKISYMEDFNQLSIMKNNSNIITFCHIGMDIFKINNCNSNLICIFFNDFLNDLSNYLKYDFKSYTEFNYINRQDPIILLKHDPIKIKKESNQTQNSILAFYSSIFIKNIITSKFKYFGNEKSLKSDNILSSRFSINKLDNDINLLCYKNILTSKLAIALYKITTLNFHYSNTKIGLYYKEELGISSKTMQLPNLDKEKIIISILKAKKIDVSAAEAINYYNKNKDKFSKEEINHISNLPIFTAKAYDLNKCESL